MAWQLSLQSVFALLAVFIAVTTAQQCYGFDGIALDNTYTPCNPGAKHSGCCATKRTNESPDICLDNGLCMSTKSEELGMIWQTGCTDKTGRDTACSKVCSNDSTHTALLILRFGINNSTALDKINELTSVTAWQIQTCNYGTYCCRAAGDRRSCCDDANVRKISTNSIGALLLWANNTTATASSTTKSAQATASSKGTPLADTAAPLLNSCEKKIHKLVVVGGILGATVLALVGAVYWMYTRERKQRKLKHHYEKQFSQTNAYRKALASTVSLMGNLSTEDLQYKSNAVYASVATSSTRGR